MWKGEWRIPLERVLGPGEACGWRRLQQVFSEHRRLATLGSGSSVTLSVSIFYDEETEAQEGSVTCLRPRARCACADARSRRA